MFTRVFGVHIYSSIFLQRCCHEAHFEAEAVSGAVGKWLQVSAFDCVEIRLRDGCERNMIFELVNAFEVSLWSFRLFQYLRLDAMNLSRFLSRFPPDLLPDFLVQTC